VRPAMQDWRLRGADFVLADRAACFRRNTFDLVATNPPYLEGGGADLAVDGGPGLAVPLAFLKDGLGVVKESGSLVIMIAGGSDLAPFMRACEEAGFVLEKVDSERLFYEELDVYRARRASPVQTGTP
jgi:methylase of polypeptide subunit release factors